VLVEPDDPQALAAALSNVLTEPHLATRLGLVEDTPKNHPQADVAF